MDAIVIRMPDRLGDLLRAARARKGWTQAHVAQRLGVSTQAVSKLERNAGRASINRVHRLCLLLDLELVLRDRSVPPIAPTDW